MMNLKSEIVDHIAGLFGLFGQSPVPAALAAYAEQLFPFGPQVLDVIKQCVIEQVSGELTKMPSVRDFKIRMGFEVAPDKKQASVEAASLILHAVSRYGYNNWDEAKEYIGSLAVEVVRRQGGWVQVCDCLTNENKTIYQSQWAKLALALLEKPPGSKPPELNHGEGQAGIPADLFGPTSRERTLSAKRT